jgi:hypothetical protein
MAREPIATNHLNPSVNTIKSSFLFTITEILSPATNLAKRVWVKEYE